MKDKIVIGTRKIGPGLKAFLKFNHFAGTSKIDLGGEENMKRLALQPLDPELFEIILLGIKHVRTDTRDYLLNHWIPKGLPAVSDQDAIRIIACLAQHTYSYRSDPYMKGIPDRLASIIDKNIPPPFPDDQEKMEKYLSILCDNDYNKINDNTLAYIVRHITTLNDSNRSEVMSHYFNTIPDPDYTETGKIKRNPETEQEVKRAFNVLKIADEKTRTYILCGLAEHCKDYLTTIVTPEGHIQLAYNVRKGPGRPKKTNPVPANPVIDTPVQPEAVALEVPNV